MSISAIFAFIFSVVFIRVYIQWLYKGDTLYKRKVWRRHFLPIYLINAISFFSIAMMFLMTYGYITDDKGYFRHSINYQGSFFESSGTTFMWYISKPLTTYLKFNLPACHILFGTFGFVGSLNFLKLFSLRTNYSDKKYKKNNQLKMYAIMCFPNFMAWGRFYGKDSSMFFLASVYILNVYSMFINREWRVRTVLGIVLPLIVMFKIRPHIAGALLVSFAFGLIFILYKRSVSFKPSLRAIYRYLFPVVIIGVVAVLTIKMISRVSGEEDVSVEIVQGSIVSAAKMGAYGGSSTELAGKLRTDPSLLYRPQQILINVINLYMSPFPWKVRGGSDVIALLSNVLLLWLIYKFRKDITIDGLFQKYLLIIILFLTALISFMSGNVGLILRQKTVILPFILLFIFYRKEKQLNKYAAQV